MRRQKTLDRRSYKLPSLAAFVIFMRGTFSIVSSCSISVLLVGVLFFRRKRIESCRRDRMKRREKEEEEKKRKTLRNNFSNSISLSICPNRDFEMIHFFDAFDSIYSILLRLGYPNTQEINSTTTSPFAICI